MAYKNNTREYYSAIAKMIRGWSGPDYEPLRLGDLEQAVKNNQMDVARQYLSSIANEIPHTWLLAITRFPKPGDYNKRNVIRYPGQQTFGYKGKSPTAHYIKGSDPVRHGYRSRKA